MKYVKQFLQGGVFLVVCAMAFWFSGSSVFAAEPNSDSTCYAIKISASEGSSCRAGATTCEQMGKKKYGHCDKEDTDCCVPSGYDPNNPSDSTGSITKTSECTEKKGTCGLSCTGGTTKIGTCVDFSEDSTNYLCCASSNSTNTSSSTSASLNYTPLENLPGFEGQSGNFATYFKNLYLFALWIVGISALFMLVVGGFLYLSSAGNTSLLGTAKKTIYGALIGLIIALISWLLLDTINSDLTKLKLSGLSGAVGGGETNGSGNIPEENKGKGSGCGGAELQGGSHCEDASQDLSDVLKCMVDKLGSKKMQISSISDDSGGKSIFTQCRDSYKKPPCEHGNNSCHYGGSKKNDKSCAADISGSYMGRSGAASSSEVKSAASSCGAGYVLNEGDHVHLSVKGCGCN